MIDPWKNCVVIGLDPFGEECRTIVTVPLSVQLECLCTNRKAIASVRQAAPQAMDEPLVALGLESGTHPVHVPLTDAETLSRPDKSGSIRPSQGDIIPSSILVRVDSLSVFVGLALGFSLV